MARYIDADALKKTIDEEIFRHDTIDHVFQIIDDAPSIDIVRCSECRYSRGVLEYCAIDYWVGDADGYCSYGERKSDE